jgi:hypothetical protein
MKLIYNVKWDSNPPYVTSKSGNKYYPWLFFGPVVSADGVKIWNIIIGKLIIGWGRIKSKK